MTNEGLEVKEWYILVSCVRKSTLSTRSVNRDKMNIHVGMTRFNPAWLDNGRPYGSSTNYSHEKVG